jgi:hypothetical protein
MITYEMLAVLHNETVAAKKVTRTWEKQFAKMGAKIGQQVQIRKPPLYTVTDGQTFVAQDYTETMVPLVVDHHKQIGVEFLNDDMTLSMDDFSGRFLKPAMVPLANQVDVDILANYFLAWNATGTPGVIAATDTPFLDANTLLLANAAPGGEWPMLTNPTVSARLSSGLAGRFNPQGAISNLYDKGKMGPFGGWDFYRTQNMPTLTTGNWSASVPGTGLQVNLANQSGSTINIKGATATTTTGAKGDVVQFAGVYQVNPITFINTGILMNFTLTADVTADGGGLMALPIAPPLNPYVGKTQNVTASPANNAQVYVWGTATVANVANQTSPQMLGFAKEGITLACVDLYMPGTGEGVKAVRAQDDDLGLSVLFMRAFDPREYSAISRLDMLYGTTFPRPEHVVRVAS